MFPVIWLADVCTIPQFHWLSFHRRKQSKEVIITFLLDFYFLFLCVKTSLSPPNISLSLSPLFFKSEMSRQTATALPTGTSKCPPSQRVPTLSGTTASNSDLASLFECPVCFDYVLPPILQCQSGHLVGATFRLSHTCLTPTENVCNFFFFFHYLMLSN